MTWDDDGPDEERRDELRALWAYRSGLVWTFPASKLSSWDITTPGQHRCCAARSGQQLQFV